MLDFIRNLFSTDFMPHVYCLRQPDLIWLHFSSDGVIALSYFLIPLALVLLMRRRRDLVFSSLFGLFSLFIVGCGLTHVLGMITLWYPVYRLDGLIKGVTALASLGTAVVLFRWLPEIVAFPSPAMLREEVSRREELATELRALNQELEERVAERTAQLSESENALRALLESASQGIIGVDEEGAVRIVNAMAQRMFGYSREELLSGSLEMLIPDRVRQQHKHDRAKYFAEPRMRPMGQNLDLSARRKDGSEFPVEISLSYVNTKRGILAVAFVTDISERKRAEQAVRDSEERFRTLTQAAPSMLWSMDAQGNCTYVSSRYEAYSGLGKEDLVRDGWLGCLHPEDRERAEETWSKAFALGQPFEFESRLRGRDGSYRWFVVRGVPMRGSDGQIKQWFGSSTDVDKLMRAEDALRRSNEGLRQFAYAAAHDLQEPLRNVANSVDVLQRLYAEKLDPAAMKWMSTTSEGAQRMLGMVGDLLMYSRAVDEHQERSRVSASEAVQIALANLKETISSTGARIEIEPLPELNVCKFHLVQLFQNVVANALKYRKPDVPPEIRIDAQGTSGEWEFRISDNGIGFDPQYAERIFGVFKRLHTRKEYPGNGIGLAICARVVNHYGGRIWAEGEPGKGATFHFTLAA